MASAATLSDTKPQLCGEATVRGGRVDNWTRFAEEDEGERVGVSAEVVLECNLRRLQRKRLNRPHCRPLARDLDQMVVAPTACKLLGVEDEKGSGGGDLER